MDDINFDNMIENFFTLYKTEVLGIKENGLWKDKNGKEHSCSWILPMEKKFENIISSDYKQNIIDSINKQEKESHNTFLDKNFHNLKSSQALCFNLFYPITFKKYYCYIDKTIKIDDYTYPYFELKSKFDGTKFDFYIGKGYEIKKGMYNGYSFEIKYSEKNFSTETPPEKIKERYDGIYKNKIKEFSQRKYITIEIFYEYYQLFRNIFYSTDAITYFVIPNFRNNLNNIIETIINEYCTSKQSNKIKILYIEDIISRIKNESKDATMISIIIYFLINI